MRGQSVSSGAVQVSRSSPEHVDDRDEFGAALSRAEIHVDKASPIA
jgi:hypothetical protein